MSDEHDPGDESADRHGNWCAFCGVKLTRGYWIVALPDIDEEAPWHFADPAPLTPSDTIHDDVTSCTSDACAKAARLMRDRLRMPAQYRYDKRRYAVMLKEKQREYEENLRAT